MSDPTQKVPPGLTDSLDKIQILIERIERRQDEQDTIIADLRKRIADLTQSIVKGD